jgi:hypothetical protein
MTIVLPAHDAGGTMYFPASLFLAFSMLALAAGNIAWGDASAADSLPDKSDRTLFKPTLDSELRDLNSDRPSVTQGPYTVDAGHVQFESSFVEFTHSSNSRSHADLFNVLSTNIRIGLLNNLEMEVAIDPYQNAVDYTHTPAIRQDGFGDVQLGGKLNFWGDDGGATAFGLQAFANLPTGAAGISNHHMEGGIILPFSVTLAEGLSVAMMAEFNVDRNQSNTGYGVDNIESIILQKSVTKQVSIYVEYVGVAPIQTGRTFAVSVDTGAVFQVNPNLQFDAGINLGISKSLPNFTAFSGITLRI